MLSSFSSVASNNTVLCVNGILLFVYVTFVSTYPFLLYSKLAGIDKAYSIVNNSFALSASSVNSILYALDFVVHVSDHVLSVATAFTLSE